MDAQAKILQEYLKDLELLISPSEKGFRITGSIDTIPIGMDCVVPEAFPYVFPKIYLLEDFTKTIPSIPHLNADLSLCLFDCETDIPDFNSPDHLIEATIRKAYIVLAQGIRNQNHSDFLDEFNAYWNSTASMLFYSNVSFEDTPLKLKFYIGDYGKYITSSTEDCLRIAKLRLEKINQADVQDCIYIPLEKERYQEPIDTQHEMYRIICTKSKHQQFYANFIQNRTAEKSLVIFSQPLGNRKIISGFLHTRISPVKGFRPGKTPLGLALRGDDGAKKLEHVQIIDISQRRLFDRGGDGKTILDKKIAMIGCGSLGSNLSKTLAECGCHIFSFYDNQILTSENIARHVCGFSQVGLKKVTALAKSLMQHNPNIFVTEETRDIHEILNAPETDLNNSDYIIITVANVPIEYRFVEQHLAGRISKPIIIMWVEPYVLAGHALILHKPQNVFKELFSEDMTFPNSIIENGNGYFKREAGCQSTYVPYSGLDVKAFTIAFVKFLMSPQCDHNKNYHFLWTGNLSAATDYNVVLSDNAYGLEDNKHYIERID